MKQAIAAFLLCLSLVLGGVALAAHTLQEDAGQVAVTAISRQGDPAAAQGLVATQSCQYAQTLLWDLTIPLDRPAQSTTAFSAQGDVPAAANDDAGVYLRFPHQDATLSAEPGYSLDPCMNRWPAVLRPDRPGRRSWTPVSSWTPIPFR